MNTLFGPAGDIPEAFANVMQKIAEIRASDAEAGLEAYQRAEYELERAMLRNGAGALSTARQRQERTMTQHEITQEIKMRAGKLRRESGGTISMTEAIQRVAPEVMEAAASSAPPPIEQPTVRAAREAAENVRKGLDEAYCIVDRAQEYQREQRALGIRVSNAEAVNHVTQAAA